jgi:hypothetical protein
VCGMRIVGRETLRDTEPREEEVAPGICSAVWMLGRYLGGFVLIGSGNRYSFSKTGAPLTSRR